MKAHWVYLNGMIGSDQALCYYGCSGVFAKKDMMQKYVNIRNQVVEMREVRFCPEHYKQERSLAGQRHKTFIKEIDKDKLEDLRSVHATGKKGCAYEHCSLDGAQLLELLKKEHGSESGTRLYCTSFEWDCEPRRSDHKLVSKIYNRVVRQKERLTCQVLCQSGCHAHKTWENLDWNKVGVIIARKGTSEDRMKYLELKLKRFEGLDDNLDGSRRNEKGCQGYKDGKGGHYECPFQE
jgi:hypothetical protein